jgi:hypothetical protein
MIDDVTGGDGGTLSPNAVPTDSAALRIDLMPVSEFAVELAAVTLKPTHTKAS